MFQGLKTGRVMTLAATIAVLLSGPALAGDPDRSKLDTNGDGKVDFAEVQAARPDFTLEQFNAADANRDGQLSEEELRTLPGKGHHYGKLDADNDGNYTLEEVRAAYPDLTQEEYSSFDANKDGKVTKDELKLTMSARMFESMDKNRDGGVSLLEMQAVRSSMTQEKFSRMDTDGNGLLSMEELRAGHARHRGHHADVPREKPEQPGSN